LGIPADDRSPFDDPPSYEQLSEQLAATELFVEQQGSRIAEISAAGLLHVGGRHRLGRNLRPQYLHGRTVIIAKEGEMWVVRLEEEPVGRFANAEIRLFARRPEPA